MQPWTLTHLKIQMPVFALMALAAWLLRHALRGKRECYRLLPVQVVSLLVLLLEIVKQYMSLRVGYDLLHLPLHYCAVITFLLPVAAFCRGRYAAPLRGVIATLCAGLFALLLLAPDYIYSDIALREYTQNFFSFHTVTYHWLAAFAFMLIFALDLHEPRPRRDLKTGLTVMLIYCVVAATAANLLKTNFHNFYYCLFPPAEALRLAFRQGLGDFGGQALYAALFTLVNLAALTLAYLLYYLLCRLKRRK